MEINDILANSSYFLRVYELKKKNKTLNFEKSKKKTVIRQLSCCIYEKSNGFNIIIIEHGKKLRKKFGLNHIIYKPVEKPDAEINCLQKFSQQK